MRELMKNLSLALVVAAALICGANWGLVSPANANSSAAAEGIREPDRILPFAKRVERELAERGARVAIVARLGTDPASLPDGIDYTHVGFWVYSDIKMEDGRSLRGYASHNLYQLSENRGRSALIQDFPPEFFADVVEMKTGIIIPSPELQERLLAVIESDLYRKLHVPEYSLVANPNRRTYQNCTNFVASVLAAAIYGVEDPVEVTALLESHYKPQKIGLGGFERFLGRVFVDGFETDDHDGQIYSSTFGSVAGFLETQGLAAERFTIVE